MKENSAFSPAEQRQAERQSPLQSRKGKLHLSIEGQPKTYGISALRDISPFGVGVESSLLVEEGKRIQLTYKEADLALIVVGTVAWHIQTEATRADTAKQEQYQLGIELSPAGIAENIDLFRYMSGIR